MKTGQNRFRRMSRKRDKKTSPFRGGFVPMAAGAGHGTEARERAA